MKRNLRKYLSFLMILALTAPVVKYAMDSSLAVEATSIDRTKENIDRLNEEIRKLNERIGSMEEEQDILEEEMEDLNAEIINTDRKSTRLNSSSDIEDTETEYEKAKEQEEQQYADMVIRLRKMYENGETGSLELLFSGVGLGDMLNRMDYVESVYEYDRNMLEQYETTKDQVLELWNQLESDKLALENTKSDLVLAQENLKAQKVELDGLLTRKKQQSANYDAEIKKARQEASVAKTKLQQEQQALKKLQAGGGGNAANGTYTTDYNALIDAAPGTDLGRQIAKYACQYIGNPYVAGGTSLTNGADCSGFTYRVYSDFGYRLPRTSTEQRGAGKGVNYSDAQPGDLICYSGHVALYIGGGKIVHASTQKTGIKVGNAEYRTILAVRRII